MKFKVSKKLIVSSLASVMAVSLVGAVTGTVAWYQYNTRVTASLIGFNAAETGILEISTDNSVWKRDLTTADLVFADSRVGTELHPMTFNTGANQTATGALTTTNAYKNPDVVNKEVASDGTDWEDRGHYDEAWDEASAQYDYIQFDLYVRAREVSESGFTQTAEDVYMTDFVLANVGSGAIVEGLRIHMAIDADGASGYETNYLFSNTARNSSSSNLVNLYGNLDQDNDGIADRVGGYEWATHRDDVITYGEGTYTQETLALGDKLAERDGSTYAIAAADAAKKLFTTPTSGSAHILVTMWLEGWDLLGTGKEVTKYTFAATDPAPEVGTTVVTSLFEQYKLGASTIANNYVQSKGDANGKAVSDVTYYTRNSNTIYVADWSGVNTDGAAFQFGITFDIGRGTFAD